MQNRANTANVAIGGTGTIELLPLTSTINTINRTLTANTVTLIGTFLSNSSTILLPSSFSSGFWTFGIPFGWFSFTLDLL